MSWHTITSGHTTEPWPPYGPFLGLPRADDGSVLISAADYSRAQQCVNACACMKDPMAEVRALRKDSDYLVTSERMRAEVIQQRDALLAAVKLARPIIQEDRDTMFDCHMCPATGQVEDERGKEGIRQCDEALAAIDAAVAAVRG